MNSEYSSLIKPQKKNAEWQKMVQENICCMSLFMWNSRKGKSNLQQQKVDQEFPGVSKLGGDD